ncbi:hypothetical protein EGW08_021944 [Elysia chlorotica]|uniref:Deoxynucleoside kinase domain-containing protein n=1 Tax=Elysia chlorotica TaxID=188477 RepID=A0A433SMA2_ELYCH|nr:hypothetical protein EGW08_021944 [Elysia chlorotica]
MSSPSKTSQAVESARVARFTQTEPELEMETKTRSYTESKTEAGDCVKAPMDSSEYQRKEGHLAQWDWDVEKGAEIAAENTLSRECLSRSLSETRDVSVPKLLEEVCRVSNPFSAIGSTSPTAENANSTYEEEDQEHSFLFTTNAVQHLQQRQCGDWEYNFERWWKLHKDEALSYYDRKVGTFELYTLLTLLTANICESFMKDVRCDFGPQNTHVLSKGELKLLELLSSLLNKKDPLVDPTTRRVTSDVEVVPRLTRLYRRLFEEINKNLSRSSESDAGDIQEYTPQMVRYFASKLLQTRDCKKAKMMQRQEIPDQATFIAIEGPIAVGKSTFVLDAMSERVPVSLVGLCKPVDIWSDWQGTDFLENAIFDIDNDRFKFHMMVALMYRHSMVTNVFNPINNDLLARRAVIIVERSMWSEREVFIKMGVDEGRINATQENILFDIIDIFDMPIHEYVCLYSMPQMKNQMYGRAQTKFNEKYNESWCRKVVRHIRRRLVVQYTFRQLQEFASIQNGQDCGAYLQIYR